MTNIIVVLPKLEEAKGVKNILVRSGFQVTGICTTGTQAISQADGLNDGIVICSYKLADMIYTCLLYTSDAADEEDSGHDIHRTT